MRVFFDTEFRDCALRTAVTPLAVYVLGFFLALTGCRGVNLPEARPRSGTALHGGVHGGQQPVAGSRVYLLAAGIGRQTAAVSLLGGGITGQTDSSGRGYVLTDASGGFNITGDYACPQPQAMVYVLAVGGNPGLAAGQENADLALMTGLGSCDALLANAASTHIAVNEVTTVVTVYQLSGFLAGAFQLSYDGSQDGLQQISAAFASIQQMADTNSGVARSKTLQGDATVPTPAINTIAEYLAACVNSTGSRNNNQGACGRLERGVVSNTVDAMVMIVNNPTQNVSTSVGLASAMPPFQPTLAAPPASFVLALSDPDPTPGCAPNCPVFAVNAGGGAAGGFLSDVGFSGGATSSDSASVQVSGIPDAAPMEVYQTYRVGTFSYTAGGFVTGSSHRIRLHFCESYWSSPGSRIFDVAINGTPVLRHFDIVAAAGGRHIALVETFVATADDSGRFELAFSNATIDQPMLSGFEIQ